MSTIASEKSVNYLRVVWGERTDNPFPFEKFKGRTQREISATINRALARPALPPTEEQLDEIRQLCATVEIVNPQTGEVTHPTIESTADRAQANKQLNWLREKNRKMQFERAKKAADAELDDLFAPTAAVEGEEADLF